MRNVVFAPRASDNQNGLPFTLDHALHAHLRQRGEEAHVGLDNLSRRAGGSDFIRDHWPNLDGSTGTWRGCRAESFVVGLWMIIFCSIDMHIYRASSNSLPTSAISRIGTTILT